MKKGIEAMNDLDLLAGIVLVSIVNMNQRKEVKSHILDPRKDLSTRIIDNLILGVFRLLIVYFYTIRTIAASVKKMIRK